MSSQTNTSACAHESRRRSESANSNVAHKSVAASSAERDVSQIHSKGIMIAPGKRAQSHAATAPTPRLATRLPTWKIGMHTTVEKRMFRKTRQKNDETVKIPKSLNVAATKSG